MKKLKRTEKDFSLIHDLFFDRLNEFDGEFYKLIEKYSKFFFKNNCCFFIIIHFLQEKTFEFYKKNLNLMNNKQKCFPIPILDEGFSLKRK